MRKILYTLFAITIFTACSSKQETEKPDIAGQTALEYYKLLQSGKFEDFVAGMDGAEDADDAYRKQLIDNAAMFAAQMKKEHNGILKIEKQMSAIDEEHHSAEAFLTISFADSKKEQIVVPMTERNDIWYMK